jgi:hypothetical protein
MKIGELELSIPLPRPDIWAHGDHLYLGQFDRPGLLIVDVTQRDRRREVGSVATRGPVSDFVIVQNYVFAAQGEAGLEVFEISDPETLEIVGFITPVRSFVTV